MKPIERAYAAALSVPILAMALLALKLWWEVK